MQTSDYRLVDANLNRLKEGVRVVEDICRYSLNNHEFAIALKKLRHSCTFDQYDSLLEARDIINDCLKESTKTEMTRVGIKSILLANFKRAQESSRVLEEICKLNFPSQSSQFKSIRYELYNLEKEVIKSISNSK